ncbi:hypothetical protein V8J88_12225 [Massilia sp. W12]|uniref:hypothetical protein n=1 Tax=Massilia sp. W12 TaxID=3126507 RepID=UPI0030D5EAAB
MAFNPVSEVDSGSDGGKFTVANRKFFNACGAAHFMGKLQFQDVSHAERAVPIFHDDCLEDKPETYALLRNLRKAMKLPSALAPSYALGQSTCSVRSFHQNENGYLPFKDDGGVSTSGLSAPAIGGMAIAFGGLPNNQKQKGSGTNGQFLEYTCGDGMHVECRLIVDYRFGFIYMTLGHYHKDSFAMLARSEAEINFELKPTLPALGARFGA